MTKIAPMTPFLNQPQPRILVLTHKLIETNGINTMEPVQTNKVISPLFIESHPVIKIVSVTGGQEVKDDEDVEILEQSDHEEEVQIVGEVKGTQSQDNRVDGQADKELRGNLLLAKMAEYLAKKNPEEAEVRLAQAEQLRNYDNLPETDCPEKSTSELAEMWLDGSGSELFPKLTLSRFVEMAKEVNRKCRELELQKQDKIQSKVCQTVYSSDFQAVKMSTGGLKRKRKTDNDRNRPLKKLKTPELKTQTPLTALFTTDTVMSTKVIDSKYHVQSLDQDHVKMEDLVTVYGDINQRIYNENNQDIEVITLS